MPEDEVEVTLELRTHSGISEEDMLDAMGRYIDGQGSGFVFGDDALDGLGRLTSAVGVITQVDLEDGKLTATVRLLDSKLSWSARVVQALCEAKRPPYLSPIGMRRDEVFERVISVIVKPGDPAVPKESG